jgi:AraC family transcriptional regulator, transcriptional activator of pobA
MNHNSDVKTYHKVNRENESLSFGISKMEDIYLKHNGIIDEPHRHDFYTVLVVKKAKGQHKIDFFSYDLGKHQIYFISPGQVHQVIEEEMSHGFAMTFSNHFLVENSIHLSFIESLNLFHDYGQSPPLLPQ